MTSRLLQPWSLLLATAICVGIFSAAIPLPRGDDHLLGSDGLRYYSILRSAVLDHDFDFTNDYRMLGVEVEGVTPTGLKPNPFAIGSAVLWLPFFLLAHVLSLILSWLGLRVATDGVSYVYESFVCIGTILYAGTGFLLAYRTAARVASSQSAVLAALAMWWATQAIYYIVAEPSMSHGLTIFTQALFLYVWYPPRATRSWQDWLKIGLAVTLVGLVRWQEIIIVAIPLAELCYRLVRRQLSAPRTFSYGLMLGAMVLIGFLPQFVMWDALYGSPVTMPQGESFMNWMSPKPIETLFSTRHGLISWHPVFLLALTGLVGLWRRDRALTLAIAFLFLGQLYINSSVERWWADDSFGARRFTGLAALLVLPLAALLDNPRPAFRQRLLVAVLVLLVIWNGLGFIQYRLGFVSMSEALTLEEMTIDRLLVPFRLLQRLMGS
jgi:hypothetical protein